MRVSLLVLSLSVSLFGVGCSSLPKPWKSDRRGILDHRSHSAEDTDGNNPVDHSDESALERYYEKGPSKTDHASSGEDGSVRPGRSASLTREAARYFRDKKQRTRLYAKEVSHTADDHDLQWPLAHIDVSSHFGKRGRNFHEGVDLRAQVGTPVRAAQAGKVIYAASKIRGYGKMIVIRHPGNLATIYAHNSSLLVKRGQFVKQGQEIALSGNSGRSSGPHLHFEVRRDVAAVNPLQLLPLARNYEVSSASEGEDSESQKADTKTRSRSRAGRKPPRHSAS